jgi:hypothetical protein
MRRYRFIIARDNERLYEHRRVAKRRGGGSSPGREGQADRRIQTRVDEGLRGYGWAFVKIERP